MLGRMTTLQGEYEDLTITENTTIQGAVRGDLTILSGKVVMQGAVTGTVIARGGQTDISGVVGGVTLAGGEVRIAVGTIIGGRILQEDGSWLRPTQDASISVGPKFTYLNAEDVI